MKRFGIAATAAVVLWAGAAAGQRVEFQRQKFDRSRFARPGAAAVQEPVQTEPAAPAAAETPAVTMPVTGTEEPRAPYGGGGSSGLAQAKDGMLSTGVPVELAEKPKFELVPKKWFTKADEWEELKELQKETGACILVYFKDPTDSSQKGLCNWFEKDASTYTRWRKAMPYFIKLQVTLPGNSDVRALAATFGFKSTPAWYVVRPDAQFPKRLPVIKYSTGGKNPEPMPEKELIPALHDLCTPAYDGLF